jgi:hypothetical protein
MVTRLGYTSGRGDPCAARIGNWKDFLVHLATITVGILIAPSLEGVRETFRERALVREARENIRRELADDKRGIDGEIAAVDECARQFDALSSALGILTAAEGGDPTNASPAELERFREPLVALRSVLFVEEQLARGLSETYKKTLE